MGYRQWLLTIYESTTLIDRQAHDEAMALSTNLIPTLVNADHRCSACLLGLWVNHDRVSRQARMPLPLSTVAGHNQAASEKKTITVIRTEMRYSLCTPALLERIQYLAADYGAAELRLAKVLANG